MDYEESSVNSVDIDNKIAAFILKKKGLDKNEVKPEYTDLKIITHVAKAQLNVNLNLDVVSKFLYTILDHNKKYGIDTDLRGVDYMGTKLVLDEKEKKSKKKKEMKMEEGKTGKKEKQHGFSSACTVIVRTSNKDENQRIVNFKLFDNAKGSISMTGLEYTNSGMIALEYFLNLIGKNPKFFKNTEDINKIAISNYQIVNVVSMIRTNFKIDPTNLDEILKNEYGILSSWDSSRYSAVYVSYIWNDTNEAKDGLCHCIEDLKCKGKGFNGTCKNVTIIIYESGKGNVTGANSMIQAIEAYEFIKNIILQNRKNIVKLCVDDIKITEKELNDLTILKKKKKKVLVPEEIIE